jgi:hypothetical protein
MQLSGDATAAPLMQGVAPGLATPTPPSSAAAADARSRENLRSRERETR